MSCDPWMEAISSRADGEPFGIDERLLDAHIASCASCRAFEADIHHVSRAAAITVAEPVSDLSAHVVRAARAHDRGSVWWVLRLGLGVVAIQVIVLSASALLLGRSDGSDEHAARHLGSFAIAYAVGLLVVALRPAKARGMLPLAGALAVCLAITAVIDIADGHTPVIAEVRHIPEVVGLVLVWLLASPRTLPRQPQRGPLPMLTVVADDADAAARGRQDARPRRSS